MRELLYIVASDLVSPVEPSGLPQTQANQSEIETIVRVVLNLAGAIALLVIVISGLRYVLAGGDAGKTKKAKEGIVYAFVGLAIAIVAQGIVAFVVNRL